ncbi:DUF6573 family protein [Streptomyces sp. NPDC049555]|uniref:DUF6573 family protein n=1 Tax=Streptomyces sp. NPDC049555 TaxID=3154930 RepID=UPI00342A386B
MFDWDSVIHACTRADLVADGDLVEIPWIVSNSVGLKWPVAFTRAAWLTVMDGTGEERWPEAADPLTETLLAERATRALTAAVQTVATTASRASRIAFDVPLYGVTLHLHVGPGDDGAPVFTVLMPDED